MLSVSTYQPPTSVCASISCFLTSSEDENLVVAKLNKIEVFNLLSTNIQFQCSIEIWGTVTGLHALYQKGSKIASLCVTTDLPQPRALLLDYSTEEKCLKVKQSLPISHTSQPSQFGTTAVDSLSQLLVSSNDIGILKVMALGRHGLDMFECRVRHLMVVSMCFLPTDTPILVLLYQDHLLQRHIIAYPLSTSDKELSPSHSPLIPKVVLDDTDVNILVPVPDNEGAPGGVLLLGGAQILFYEMCANKKKRPPTSSTARVDWLYSSISSYTHIDDSKILVSDAFGRLVLLYLARSQGNKGSVKDINVIFLGESSPASCLTYLNASVFFLGSHFGDSSLLKIIPESGNGSHLAVIEAYKNIAPIVDAILADIDASGEPQLVTCSGGANTGSLRVIRNGADFQESAVIESVTGVTSIWPLRENFSADHDAFAILTTFTESLLIQCHDDGVDTVTQSSFPAIVRDAPTMAIGNMAQRTDQECRDSSLAIQVTSAAVIVFDVSTRLECSRWIPPHEIVATSINPTQVCVALQGGQVILLHLDGDILNQRAEASFHLEVSTVSVCSIGGQTFSNIVAVGFWDENKVVLLRAADLRQCTPTSITLSHVPRTLIRCRFAAESSKSGQFHLLIGLGDGTLTAIEMNEEGQTLDRKTFSLGSRPVHLSPSLSGDTKSILACGSRAIALFWETGRLQHSPIAIKDVVCATQINSQKFPSSLIFATPSDVFIGQLQQLQKLHIHTIPFGLDNPKRVAYHPGLKVFGVGCLRIDPSRVGANEIVSSSFKLIDDTTFEHLNNFLCESDEEVSSVVVERLAQDGERPSDYFILGTVRFLPDEREPTRGRILVFDGSASRSTTTTGSPILWKAAEIEVAGCVYSLTSIENNLAAAVNTSLQIFQFNSTGAPGSAKSGILKLVARWDHNCLLSNLVAWKDKLILADAVQSITVLQFDGQKLTLVARDYSSLWPRTITTDGEHVIGADSDCNLFTFKIGQSSLEREGRFHFGEPINKILRGTLTTSQDSSKSVPIHAYLLFTVGGRISVISSCDSGISLQLSDLQRNMQAVIEPSPGIDHARWRAPSNSRGSSDLDTSIGFIDGDFLQRFLDFEESSLETTNILKGTREPEKLKQTFLEVRSMVESLI